jgi:hypothetical protein
MQSKVASLEDEVKRLNAEKRRHQLLISLLETSLKCTSPNMLAQAVGPEFVKLLKPERLGLFMVEPQQGFALKFSHFLENLNAEQQHLLSQCVSQGVPVDGSTNSGGSKALAFPLIGKQGGAFGALFADLGAGRDLPPETRELALALCAQLSTALSNLFLSQQIRREEQVRFSLSRYLSSQVADAVISGQLPMNFSGERRQVTVMFVDVRGFTSLSEQLPPEYVLEMLNEYFSAVVPIVKQAEGTVDKFIGDALMAVLVPPTPWPTRLGVRFKRLFEFNRRWAC